MSPFLWSWIAAAVSIFGCWIGGRNPKWGWGYGIAAQGVWIAYGLLTNQPGMLALSFVLIAMDVYNLHRWDGTNFVPVRKHGVSR